MDKSSEHLTIYLEQIHSFLISNDDCIIFPSPTMSIEDILVNIVKDTNFLKQSRFVDCKSLVEKLTVVLDKNKEVFTLSYEFQFDDKRKKVMVYKKIPVTAIQEPVSVLSKPLRKPNVTKEKTEDSTPKSVMSSFKITFLNATLKFVKDDSQMVLSYPNMSSEQADFVKQMIDQCMKRDGAKAVFKGLYDPLAEALKIFSLKYDFKLYVGTLDDMKKLRFEKIRKKSDTSKSEGTRIIYEETTDSDSSLKQVGKSKIQKKLTTLIDAITQITPAFKQRTLKKLKDFLIDKNKSIHTFSNLTLQEQQFISQWQVLTQRVEVMKMLDVQGQIVLDEIRGCLKKKNYRVKVELGMTASQKTFAKLTKVMHPKNVRLSEEEKAARLEAMVLPTNTRQAVCAAGLSSSGNSSSDSNSKPPDKFKRKVANFFRKTNGVKNDWIVATFNRLRNFLQDEAEASLLIPSITELQTAFLAKWQNLLTNPEVIKAYPTDVQVLMHDVREVASVNKKKFRVEFRLTKFRNGKRDARFAKLPVFGTTTNKTSKENVPVNIPHKSNDNKTENGLDSVTNVKKMTKENILVNIPPKNKENKTENCIGSIRNGIGIINKTSAVKIDPKKCGNKSEISSEKTAVPTNTKIPKKGEPKGSGNKGEIAAQKATVPKPTNLAAGVKLKSKNEENKGEKSSEKAVPKTTKCPPPENYETKEISKKVDIFAEKAAAAPKQKNLVAPVKIEPKQSDDKAEKTRASAMKARSLKPIHKSTSLTSLDQKDIRAKKPNKVVKLSAATVKLIEALNQPLVSERGLKMMRQMGWEGGPLGVRGEGIAEPLMPEIDLGKRAGFGAPKPNIKELVAASKSTDDLDFREADINSVEDDLKNDVMQTLLRMVKGDEPQRTEIKFDRELTMPDWSYIKIVAAMFNNREMLRQGMSPVLKRVTDDELMLTAAWSWAKTEILLSLSKYSENIKINRRQWGYVALPKETLTKRNRKRLVELIAARDIDNRVMVTGQAFKYFVMAQMLDFCLNCNAKSPTIKEVTKDIILKGTMVKKQLSFIRDVVRRVNSSARSSSGSVQAAAIHDEIITAMQGKGYKMDVEFPSLKEVDGQPVHNIISLTKTYGYRAKTVLIKMPPVTQETTMNNNSTTRENKNLQPNADIIEKHNMDNEVKSSVVSKTNEKYNVMDVDETITKNKQINSENETENTQKYHDFCNNFDELKDDLENKHNNSDKVTEKYNTNQKKPAVDDEEKVSIEYIILEKQLTETVNYIENTDKPRGTENNAHSNNKVKSHKTKGFNDKQNNHSIQSTSTEPESVKDNIIIDRDLSTIDNEKRETDKNDKASQIKTDANDNSSQCVVKSINNNNIANKICNVTISNESFKTDETEKAVVLFEIDKEIGRFVDDAKNQSINDIIASFTEINIVENTKSEKVMDVSKDAPIVSPIEVNKNNENSQTFKRLSKRIRSMALSSDRSHKRTKYDYVKHINIEPKDYPQTKITKKMAAEIQKSIQQSIDYSQVLPLLKCHGIQDGVLSYSCHNEKSLELIQNVVKAFDLNVTLTEEIEKGTCRMSLKINTFIDETVESIFNNLETFNLGLSTKDWVFLKKEQYSDFIVIFVDMDSDSYKFIRGENFKLYAGIDEARFSIVWG